jgi:hypothetical protein
MSGARFKIPRLWSSPLFARQKLGFMPADEPNNSYGIPEDQNIDLDEIYTVMPVMMSGLYIGSSHAA